MLVDFEVANQYYDHKHVPNSQIVDINAQYLSWYIPCNQMVPDLTLNIEHWKRHGHLSQHAHPPQLRPQCCEHR